MASPDTLVAIGRSSNTAHVNTDLATLSRVATLSCLAALEVVLAFLHGPLKAPWGDIVEGI